MTVLSRRAALLAACGSVVGGASVGTWLVHEWVHAVPTPGQRIRTAFGAVVLLASRREPATTAAGSPGVDGVGVPDAGGSDQVVVLVEVRNESGGPVRIAPGQFQLRAGDVGPAVAFLGAEPYGGVVAPGRVLQLRLTFLVPSGDGSFGLEFWEDDRTATTVPARATARQTGRPAAAPTRGPARRPVPVGPVAG